MADQAPTKALRVALVMGGGVSLGTFSGGAMAELCRLLEGLQATRPVQIDVATGASAGAMTLAVLYRYLFAGGSAQQVKAAMQDCWVQGVGVDGLGQDTQLLPQMDRHQAPSLLSDRPLRVLGDKHVLGFQGTGQPSSLLASTAYLSFTLTNLNGIEHRAPSHWSGLPDDEALETSVANDALVTTQFLDRMRFRVQRGPAKPGPVDPRDAARPITGLGEAQWKPLLEAALASGAFPGVFPPRQLVRYREEYGELWPKELREQSEHAFVYVDGGLFDNEPLKEALELANYIDRGDDPAQYERVFLFVDPVVSGSASQLVLASELAQPWKARYRPEQFSFDYRPSHDSYVDNVKSNLSRVTTALFEQATFRDWLHLGKTNRRIEHFEELMRILAPHLQDVQLSQDEQLQLRALMRKMGAGDKTDRSIQQEEAPEPNSAYEQLRLALTRAAGLSHKRDVNVLAISPEHARSRRAPLAGDFAGAFGGFFKQEWRAYDFEVGQAVLSQILFEDPLAAHSIGVHHAPGLVPYAHPDALPASHYDLVEPQVRERVESVMQDHLENFLHGIGVPHFVDHLLAWKLKNALLERLRKASWVQTRPFLVELEGERLQERHVLSAASRNHSIAAYGNPARIVVMVEAQFDPRAPEGSPRHRLHGPQLFGSMQSPYFSLEHPDKDAFPAVKIALVGDPQDWFTWAGIQQRMRVRWTGERSMELRLPGSPL